MSSSTSSFRTELKVIASVVAALVAVELAMRVVEDRLSFDVKHIRAAPAIAAESSGTLALGNSLLREGVDMSQLPGAVAYHPDGGSIQEWAYGYRRFFADGTRRLILFTGRTHLRDLKPRPTRLGAFFCAGADIPRYFRRKGSTTDTDAEFLLARFSTAFAQRERIQPRVFTALIPHYQTALREMNARRNATRADRMVAWAYHDLELLLESAERVIIVTVPAPESYELAPEVVEVARRHGAILLDIAGDVEGIGPEHFPDGAHLNEEGKALFTRRLVSELNALPSS